MTTLESFNNAIKTLEANAHLVKRGDAREAIRTAIGELREVRYNFENDHDSSLAQQQIAKLKQLASNAADALAGCTWVTRNQIISELRKAAE